MFDKIASGVITKVNHVGFRVGFDGVFISWNSFSNIIWGLNHEKNKKQHKVHTGGKNQQSNWSKWDWMLNALNENA